MAYTADETARLNEALEAGDAETVDRITQESREREAAELPPAPSLPPTAMPPPPETGLAGTPAVPFPNPPPEPPQEPELPPEPAIMDQGDDDDGGIGLPQIGLPQIGEPDQGDPHQVTGPGAGFPADGTGPTDQDGDGSIDIDDPTDLTTPPGAPPTETSEPPLYIDTDGDGVPDTIVTPTEGQPPPQELPPDEPPPTDEPVPEEPPAEEEPPVTPPGTTTASGTGLFAEQIAKLKAEQEAYEQKRLLIEARRLEIDAANTALATRKAALDAERAAVESAVADLNRRAQELQQRFDRQEASLDPTLPPAAAKLAEDVAARRNRITQGQENEARKLVEAMRRGEAVQGSPNALLLARIELYNETVGRLGALEAENAALIADYQGRQQAVRSQLDTYNSTVASFSTDAEQRLGAVNGFNADVAALRAESDALNVRAGELQRAYEELTPLLVESRPEVGTVATPRELSPEALEVLRLDREQQQYEFTRRVWPVQQLQHDLAQREAMIALVREIAQRQGFLNDLTGVARGTPQERALYDYYVKDRAATDRFAKLVNETEALRTDYQLSLQQLAPDDRASLSAINADIANAREAYLTANRSLGQELKQLGLGFVPAYNTVTQWRSSGNTDRALSVAIDAIVVGSLAAGFAGGRGQSAQQGRALADTGQRLLGRQPNAQDIEAASIRLGNAIRAGDEAGIKAASAELKALGRLRGSDTLVQQADDIARSASNLAKPPTRDIPSNSLTSLDDALRGALETRGGLALATELKPTPTQVPRVFEDAFAVRTVGAAPVLVPFLPMPPSPITAPTVVPETDFPITYPDEPVPDSPPVTTPPEPGQPPQEPFPMPAPRPGDPDYIPPEPGPEITPEPITTPGDVPDEPIRYPDPEPVEVPPIVEPEPVPTPSDPGEPEPEPLPIGIPDPEAPPETGPTTIPLPVEVEPIELPGTDPTTEPGPVTQPETEPETLPTTFPETEPAPETLPTTLPETSPMTDPETETEPFTQPGTETDTETQPAPGTRTETETDTETRTEPVTTPTTLPTTTPATGTTTTPAGGAQPITQPTTTPATGTTPSMGGQTSTGSSPGPGLSTTTTPGPASPPIGMPPPTKPPPPFRPTTPRARPPIRKPPVEPDKKPKPPRKGLAGDFPEKAVYNEGIMRVETDFDTGAQKFTRLPRDFKGSRKPKDTYRVVRRDEDGPDEVNPKQGFIRKRLGDDGISFERTFKGKVPKKRFPRRRF